MLNKKSLRELVEITHLKLGIPEPIVEKDYYVSQLIHELSLIDNEYFELIFSGGTSLSKAFKIIKRMSEDSVPRRWNWQGRHEHHAAYKMMVGPSQSQYRLGLQTTHELLQ